MFQSMAALLKPFGVCSDFLNVSVVPNILAPGMERAIKYVQNLEEKDFKEKVGQKCFELPNLSSLEVSNISWIN